MKRCFGCEQENPDNLTYCGFCGSPLKLGDFLSRKVSEELSTTIRDRSVLETESSIKVFEKAWGWVKTVLSIAAVLVAILGAGIFWKASDLWSSVDKAKQAVQATADTSKQQIQQSATNSVQTINTAAINATDASTKASAEIDKQSKSATHETAQLKSEVGHAQTELDAANQLRPKMTAMQGQLTDAIGKVQEQQKTLSSTEDFVKRIFSSHVTRIYSMSEMVTNNSVIIPPKQQGGTTTVYLLLPEEPIEETLELQWRISVQPRYSFIHIKNVVIFSWGDSTDSLKTQPLQVSYFPDPSDKDIAHSLSYRDGRVFADDQPFPKIGEPDADFKGNKWIQVNRQP